MVSAPPILVHILLVEDDPGDRLLVERRLAEPGSTRFDVAHAATLQAGLDRLAKNDVDVVLLDLHLPDSRGISTLERLREVEARTPLVVLTTAGDEATALRALHAGAQDYLVKDEISGPLLRRAVLHAIERRRIREENEALARRVAQAEKLESLGVLAGGIAHDFDNLLAVIHMNASVAESELPERSSVRPSLQAIVAAAQVAQRRTAQLLAYSGRGRIELEPLDLSAEVRDAERLLRGLLPDQVELELSLADPSPRVLADSARLRQLLTNLVLNAISALDEAGGAIEIATGASDLDARAVSQLVPGAPLPPGRYAWLQIRDTGFGMDEATLARIFDPFFTARFDGRGLGLPAALGIVRTHDGGIRVESRPGEGSSFTAYLPLPTRPRR